MKQVTIIILTFFVTNIFAQNTGVNATNPEYTLDVRSLSIDEAAQLNISNQDKSRFIRFFSGSNLYPDPSTTWKPGHNFIFATYDDATFNFTEFMRIDSVGDVGIGIFNPEARLDIKGGDWDLDAGNPGDLRIGDTLNNLRIGVATGGGGAGISRIYSSNNLMFGVDDAPIMTMNEVGNIGINNTNPATKLDIRNIGDGEELLKLTTERPWVFKQTLTGPQTKLTLQSTFGDKIFEVVSPLESKVTAAFKTSDANPEAYLVPEDGRLGVGTYDPNARMAIDGSPALTEDVMQVNSKYLGDNDVVGIDCNSFPATGYGIGANFRGGYRGVRGIVTGGTSQRMGIGVVGAATGENNQGTRVGVWGNAYGANINWAGYFDDGNVFIKNDLRIGSGAINGATGYAVAIKGKVIAEEMRINLQGDWPDYVFDEKYNLMSIDDLEASINKEHHLPGIPSATEIIDNGLIVGEMQTKMMEKIEELTLYIIDLNKELKSIKQELDQLKESKND